VVAAIEAGADLALVGPDGVYDDVLEALDAAVTAGTLRGDRVDDALTRVRRAQGCAT
jgi:beta-glucosidase-like glycosyl hydrolase